MLKPEPIQITTYRLRSGRKSATVVTLDMGHWSPTSMVFVGASVLSQVSTIDPVTRTSVSSLKGGLDSLSQPTRRLLDKPASDLGRDDVVALLHAIESDLRDRPDLSHGRASKRSRAIRDLIMRGPDVLRDGSSLREAVVDYFPRLRRRPRLRRNDLPAAIAHQPHVDWDDLREKTLAIVQQRNERIQDAAIADLRQYETVVQQQKRWLEEPVPPEAYAAVATWHETSAKAHKITRPPGVSLDAIAAVLLQLEAKDGRALDANGWPQGWHPTFSPLADLPGFKAYQYKASSAAWMHAQNRLPNAVLTAIFILILSHTGWNTGSVGSLTADDIHSLPQGGYQLQGYKAKTDDNTPKVDVPASARWTCKAISLLLWNNCQLRALGCIKNVDTRLWLGWQEDAFSNIVEFVATNRISAFCTRHGLERFKPSELRPLKAALTYLPQRDLEAVRVLLGHQDLGVTDGYLQDTLFFRMNEANMLQFQRRIETSLTFSEGGDALLARRGLNPRDIDHALLVPTGDGGACTDRYAGPPEANLAAGEPCAGLACQLNGGCPQYQLIVSDETLEMALRTQRYYRSRWQHLSRANPDAFARLHLPRLLYMHVLLSVVHTKRPDLLRRAQEALA